MSFVGNWKIALLSATLLATAGGCSPLDSGAGDEEKESHYELGRSRVNAMDYDGAIRAFEESLETNPHSAQAHYQLAMLYENQESDPAAAIYHYQQYLKYDPKADNAEVINQHIVTCKQQLAADVLQLPSAPAAQQQLEKLTEENRRLRDQLAQWQAYYTAQQAAAKTNPPTPQNDYHYARQTQITSALPEEVTPEQVTGFNPGATATTTVTHLPASAWRGTAPSRSATPRFYTVLRGETMASIARKHGLSLEAIEAANPYVVPKKLKAGQVLNLPSP